MVDAMKVIYDPDDGEFYISNGSGGRTNVTPDPYSAHKWTEELTAGENLSDGDWCYLKTTDQKMWKTDANAEATSIGVIAVCTETVLADADGTFQLQGRYVTTGLTAGAVYYLSTTSGTIQATTRPSGSADIIRPIGQALSTTVLIIKVDGYAEV